MRIVIFFPFVSFSIVAKIDGVPIKIPCTVNNRSRVSIAVDAAKFFLLSDEMVAILRLNISREGVVIKIFSSVGEPV